MLFQSSNFDSTSSPWPGAESNCRHHDFQSCALPTELPGPDKKPARALEAGAGVGRRRPLLAPLHPRPLSRAPRVSDNPVTRHLHVGDLLSLYVANAALRRRFRTYSGGRIRTCDLRVMSPTSYQTAPPRNRDVQASVIPEVRSTRSAGFPQGPGNRIFLGDIIGSRGRRA